MNIPELPKEYDQVRMTLAQLFGKRAVRQFETLDISVGGDRSFFWIDQTFSDDTQTVYTLGVQMRHDAPLMEWLHEVSHALTAMWIGPDIFVRNKLDLEAAAFVPHAVLEEIGSTPASIYLTEAAKNDEYADAVALARTRVLWRPFNPTRDIMMGLLRV